MGVIGLDQIVRHRYTSLEQDVVKHYHQGSQSHTEGCTSLTNEMIYFDTRQYRCTILSLPLFYIYIYIYILINIKVYHKALPQFRTNYSWFQTLASIKKNDIKNRNLNCSLHTKKTNNTNKLMQISYHSTLTKIQKLQNKKKKKKKKFFFLYWVIMPEIGLYGRYN